MGSFSLPWPFGKRGAASAAGGGGGPENRCQSRGGSPEEEERRLEEFGVTPQLREFVRGFTAATFRDFPLQDDRAVENSAPSSEAVNKDLSEFQERHAILVLSNVKEISQLRYILCPRHLKEKQFWRIYFLLVKNYVAPYEIHFIQKAKLATMGLENQRSVGKGKIEVEMTVTKDSSSHSEISQDTSGV